jgi:hypothetical protein
VKEREAQSLSLRQKQAFSGQLSAEVKDPGSGFTES